MLEEYTILWFEFNLCGLQNQQDKKESFEDSQSWKTT